MRESNPKLKRPLIELLADVPDLIRGLIQAEIAAFKAELAARGKSVGVGVVLFLIALFLLFWAFAVLIESAVFAFALIVPAWAAALIVAGILLVIVAILVLIGVQAVKRGTATPEHSVKDHIIEDVDVVRGIGEYDNR
ncbi:MAG: phage holin family protein [Leifsonia sp.]